jgi:hypothetical protein
MLDFGCWRVGTNLARDNEDDVGNGWQQKKIDQLMLINWIYLAMSNNSFLQKNSICGILGKQ